jgi:RHS repeat-associated protein
VRQRIDEHNRLVHFHHDAYGRLEALTNENGERYRFAWDNADRLMAQLNLDGTQRRYRYDALDHPVYADQLAPPDDSGGARDIIVHRLERDAVGRLIAKVTDDGRTEYAYDLLDNLIGVTFTNAAGEQNSVGFSYDALGQLLTETTASGTVQHRYDELGNLTQTCTPDGRWINRLLYGSGHLHQINLDGQVICDFERDRLHREVLRTQGQMNTRSEYDNVGRLHLRTRRLNSQPKHIAAECTDAFEYNRTDNLKVRETRTRQGDLRTLFGYDPSHRITSTQNSQRGLLEQFTYDAAANLMDRQPSDGEHVSRNQLLTYQDKRYRYDPFGRLIEKTSLRHGTQHFTYDAESRLIEVRNANGHVVHMRYDPLGRRIDKRVQHPNGHPMTETRFIWDGLRLLLEETYNRPTLYLYADDGHEPLARVDGRGEHQYIRYYHNALNGLPEQLTDLDGQILWQARYQVWGNTTEETRESWFVEDQNLRFQGQYLDRETGLHYNTFRFYDPDVGRFTTPDPIGLAGGLNLYQYAPNPIGWVDPWGWSCSFYRGKLSSNASEMSPLDRKSKDWKLAIKELQLAMSNGEKFQVKVGSSSDAKAFLKESQGNMNRYKAHTQSGRDAGISKYPKGYEQHMRPEKAPGDNPHIKWYNQGVDGHIFYERPN